MTREKQFDKTSRKIAELKFSLSECQWLLIYDLEQDQLAGLERLMNNTIVCIEQLKFPTNVLKSKVKKA